MLYYIICLVFFKMSVEYFVGFRRPSFCVVCIKQKNCVCLIQGDDYQRLSGVACNSFREIKR